MSSNQNINIKEDFQNKSDTYFEANYVGNKNADRLARQNLISSVIKNAGIANLKFLDAGAGPAVLGEIVKENKGIYHASDLSIHNLISGQKRIGNFDACVADNCSLPFKKESFDVTACIGSVEYTPENKKAIAELFRVTKNGGTIILTVANKNSPANWINDRLMMPIRKLKTTFAHKPFYKRYFISEGEFVNMAQKAGVTIKETYFIKSVLLGNQLNKFSFIKKFERFLFKNINTLNKAKMEILIVAQKNSNVQ